MKEPGSDICRAIETMRKLDAEATEGPWESPWHGSPEDSALVVQARNQLSEALDVIEAAKHLNDCDDIATIVPASRKLQARLQAWADHVNGDAK